MNGLRLIYVSKVTGSLTSINQDFRFSSRITPRNPRGQNSISNVLKNPTNMKSCLIFTSLVGLFTSIHAQLTASYDTQYDNATQSLRTVACSDGPNGLITRGFTTFGSLPSFPFIGGTPAVTGYNSPGCGTCWELTYNSTSINILAIDVASYYNIAFEAMNKLTNNQAERLGRVPVTAVSVAPSYCGL